MKKLLFAAVLCALPLGVRAQEEKTERLDSVVISASRAGDKTPVSFTNVGKEELRASNPSFSLPMALELLPSVVTYNEGGTGLGNSAMTIRGSKGSQINVTLNGITLNDAESQEVFWVNIPSLTSLVANVQVQRGLGTNMSGTGDFGASINMSTALVQNKPGTRTVVSGGSFGTLMLQTQASTGRLKNGFYADVFLSLGTTDGYIRNAFVRSASAFAVAGWLGKRNSVRLTYLTGLQRSGITWDGIDLEQYEKDRRYNGAGEYYDAEGNVKYYDNQTDNYGQHHIQLNYTHSFTDALTWTTTFNYTRGDGFDEYYKCNKKIKSYGFPSIEGVPARSDMIYRKRMDNDLWVGNTSLRYRTRNLSATAGASYSYYRGGHRGEMLWVKELEAAGINLRDNFQGWYDNTGLKGDFSIFARAEWSPLEWLTAYADLQYRHIRYSLMGTDDDWLSYGANPDDRLSYVKVWPFFNPRVGVTVEKGPHRWFMSAAIGQREPGRGDIKENVKGEMSPIEPEKMLDVELGYRLALEKMSFQANLYFMEYKDMLLESGRLSSSGYAIKENVPRAWRRGIELQAAWKPFEWLILDGNATLSVNQIADYTSYVPYDDESGRMFKVSYGLTTMLMSPSELGMLRMRLMPVKGGEVSFHAKYVGKQFLDNSMRDEMAVPAYWTAGASLSYAFSFGLKLSVYANNIFNRMYYAAGWRWESYSEADNTVYSGIGVYPQPPVNFMVKAEYSF
ncbi:MAG: TonB-dependent receptor [Bacteroidales bacterium]|nr:TonB-dependent receptor [Bacteroidales bacterium]